MKIEIRDRWVKALRSGDYAQGRRMLLDAEGRRHCGLGVLCDTLGQDVQPYSDTVEGDNHTELYDFIAELLPNYQVPMTMNDKGASFDTLADWIEENIPVEEVS